MRHFHVVVVQGRQRNVQKSVMHVKIVVLVVKPFPFLTFLLPSPSSDFKVPSKKDTAGFLHLVIHLIIFFDGSPYKFQFHVACSKQIDGDPYCQALDLNIPGLQRANILSRLFGS